MYKEAMTAKFFFQNLVHYPLQQNDMVAFQ